MRGGRDDDGISNDMINVVFWLFTSYTQREKQYESIEVKLTVIPHLRVIPSKRGIMVLQALQRRFLVK